MSNKLFVLNIICTVCEMLICALVICVFAWMAHCFTKWWISLFCVIPLTVYNGWKLLAEEKEGESNAAGKES